MPAKKKTTKKKTMPKKKKDILSSPQANKNTRRLMKRLERAAER